MPLGFNILSTLDDVDFLLITALILPVDMILLSSMSQLFQECRYEKIRTIDGKKVRKCKESKKM